MSRNLLANVLGRDDLRVRGCVGARVLWGCVCGGARGWAHGGAHGGARGGARGWARGGAMLLACGMSLVLLGTAVGCGGKGGEDASPLAVLLPNEPTPGQAARDAFNVYDADLRRRSVNKLAAAKFGGEAPYVRMYRLLLDDPDPTVRAASLRALGMHGEVEDGPTLAKYLRDDFAGVRWEAAQALQKIHDPAAYLPLIERLDATVEDDADVRQAAAGALGQYPNRRVFAALVKALDDTDYGVISAAAGSLSTMTGADDIGASPAAWLLFAEKQGAALFENQRVYTWKPYHKPRGLISKAQFWKSNNEPTPQVPVGLDSE